ncbi:protein of unknown function DUF1470 [Kribbella flavida DSM 17836]|uniref:Zinc finger CGNR domain-containing protein n=1 Tax=Kribbella flavida (strain DSM 17836 / JCM 10339 / NBRC 14399) TaxID=479435 RepID=D2PUE6_KRIFD|nr:CGNR zinc finger domain-containing protein [Kribbella flavida]ADB35197.1 protein of unknown function DUF1470 [Kribbella flavida DSM 17836]
MVNGVRGREVEVLLALLNSSPMVDGQPTDALRGAGAEGWLRAQGIPGSVRSAREVRDAIALVVRGMAPADSLQRYLAAVRRVPVLTADGEVEWRTTGGGVGAHLVLAWSGLRDRIRPCENDTECRLFLLDRSKANARRWCSMSTCGNRLKARRHHQRIKSAEE